MHHAFVCLPLVFCVEGHCVVIAQCLCAKATVAELVQMALRFGFDGCRCLGETRVVESVIR